MSGGLQRGFEKQVIPLRTFITDTSGIWYEYRGEFKGEAARGRPHPAGRKILTNDLWVAERS